MAPGLPSTIGRYRVVRRLGRGGMGIVYLAHDPVIDRQVALKLLQTALDDEDAHERFRREARSAGNLTHPNIVTIFDAGEHEGQPFIAMAYIAGETLADLIQKRTPMPLSRRLELFQGLCEGLAYAHDAGVIHRDIKPANLIVDTSGRIRILDFGLARLTETTGVSRMTAAGTPGYMAPEQIAGSPTDRRCDIFSVGVVLYELLTYRKAFPGDTTHQIYNRILSEEPARISTLVLDVDPALEHLVTIAIQKAPASRYPALPELLDDLAHVRARVARGDIPDTLLGSAATTPERISATTPMPRTPARFDHRALAERRSLEIEEHVATANRALESGEPEAAIDAAEKALLLNPDEARALQIGIDAKQLLDDRHAQQLFAKGHTALLRRDEPPARALADPALALSLRSSSAVALSDDVAQVNRELELAATVGPRRERPEGPPRASDVAHDTSRSGASGPTPISDAPQQASFPVVPDRQHRSSRGKLIAAITLGVIVLTGAGWRLSRARQTHQADALTAEILAVTERANRAIADGELSEAVRLYDWALERLPNHAYSQQGKDRALNLIRARSEAQAQREQHAMASLDQADAALRRGAWDDAERWYEAARSEQLTQARALAGLEGVRAARQARTQATPPVKPTPSSVPQPPLEPQAPAKPSPDRGQIDTWLKQAEALFATKLWAEAEAKFDQVLKLDPGNVAAAEGKKQAVTQRILGGTLP